MRSPIPRAPIVGARVGVATLKTALRESLEHGKENVIRFFLPPQIFQGLNREVCVARSRAAIFIDLEAVGTVCLFWPAKLLLQINVIFAANRNQISRQPKIEACITYLLHLGQQFVPNCITLLPRYQSIG